VFTLRDDALKIIAARDDTFWQQPGEGIAMNRPALIIAVAVGAVLATAGCTRNSTSAPPLGDGNPDAYSAVAVSADDVDAAIAQLDDAVAATMEDTGIPGMAVAVVYQGTPVYTKGFGVTDVDTGAAVNADTAFQVASVSKSVSTSVVASVVSDGAVAWDDPVVEHLPEFALSDPWVTANTTLGDLFAMRSGLPHEAGDDLEELGYDRAQIIEKFRYLPLEPFRDQSLYTNFGLTAAAEAVARSQGVAWEQLAADRVYRPLGMDRTTSVYAEFLAQDNRATLHVPGDDGWVANGNRAEQAQAPAGQVSTTANDFARWMIMMLNDGEYQGTRVASAEALNQAHIPRVASEEQTDPAARTPFYGYGLGVRTDATGRVRYGFSGAYSQGAAAHYSLLPSEDLGIAVFTNAYPIGAAEGLAYSFLDSVELGENPIDWFDVMGQKFSAALAGGGAAEGGEELPEFTGEAAQPLADYAGTYDNVYYGPAQVVVAGDGTGLVVTVGPKRYEFALVPFNGNVFGTPTGQSAAGESAAGEAAAAGESAAAGAGAGVAPVAEFGVAADGTRTLELAALQAPGNSVFRSPAPAGS
jgi:CubicO group peptidase (beta-lactamase class C family)